MDIFDIIICPYCGYKLSKKRKKSSLVCHNCQKEFVLENNIIHITTQNYYYGEIPREEMQRTIGKIEMGYKWREVVSSLNNEFLEFYAKDFRRSNWRYLLPFEGKGRIALDYGCGWGAIGYGLQLSGFKVIYMDLTYERIKFVSLRDKQENIKGNIYIVGGDNKIPLADNSIDLIVMSGVLEWIPVTQKGDPYLIQLNALKNCYKILKKGGVFVLGIENRYAYRYFLGAPDDHSRLPYSSIMPRYIANIYSKLVKREEYRTYIYGYRALKDLFKKAGFKQVVINWVYPDFRKPMIVINLNNRECLNYYLNLLQTKEIKKYIRNQFLKITNKLDILKYIVYSYLLFAYK